MYHEIFSCFWCKQGTRVWCKVEVSAAPRGMPAAPRCVLALQHTHGNSRGAWGTFKAVIINSMNKSGKLPANGTFQWFSISFTKSFQKFNIIFVKNNLLYICEYSILLCFIFVLNLEEEGLEHKSDNNSGHNQGY